jgi:predicted kinase
MSELAFLLMDLDDHDLPGLSRRLLNRYLEYSGDFEGLALLRFYQVYRAMVRAKVESLRLDQLGNSDAAMVGALEDYIALAAGYTRETRPSLLIAHGLSGSGKTHVSQLLLEAAPLIRLRSDVERKRLFGLSPLDTSGSERDAGIYSKEANARTYGRLAELAKQLLELGWPVLVDAAFLKRGERDQFSQLARSMGVPFAIMHCEADMAVQRARVAGRSGDASEADLHILDLQLERQEPLTPAEAGATIAVDTTGTPCIAALLDFLDHSGPPGAI